LASTSLSWAREPGERQFELERRLATAPLIAAPTITLEGDANVTAELDPARRRAWAADFKTKV
jgi:hypothetical protein